jgi:hypothetical protein
MGHRIPDDPNDSYPSKIIIVVSGMEKTEYWIPLWGEPGNYTFYCTYESGVWIAWSSDEQWYVLFYFDSPPYGCRVAHRVLGACLDCFSDERIISGNNQLDPPTEPFGGGSFLAFWSNQYPDNPLQGQANELGIKRSSKTFYEGRTLDGSLIMERFARQEDGTCIYRKRNRTL